jgi:hypothetical protein
MDGTKRTKLPDHRDQNDQRVSGRIGRILEVNLTIQFIWTLRNRYFRNNPFFVGRFRIKTASGQLFSGGMLDSAGAYG